MITLAPLGAWSPVNRASGDADGSTTDVGSATAARLTNCSKQRCASLSFRLLRGCLNWCESEPALAGLVPSGALKSAKVRDAVPSKTVKDDCLQREQLPLWFEHVRKLTNPVHAAYLQALLLTGARREELAAIQWPDVDFQWKGLKIRDKVEGERTIPLTPYVAFLLNALPRRNEWVFSSA